MIKSEEDPMLRELQKIASDLHLEMDSPAFAKHLDARDELSPLRSDFLIPKRGGVESTYLLGNSLGLQPKAVRALLEEELEVWAEKANEGHFNHTFGRPWLTVDEECARLTLPLVGAVPDEVAIMGSLTANLHLLLCAFYHPTPERYKIIIESKAFPSDHYLVESQIRLHGLDPKEALVAIAPREGELVLRDEDVLAAIRAHGSSVAVVLFPGVQYYTGQVFNMQAISQAGHEIGAFVGLDLAHAIGNVPLELHGWGVDFAAWCSYKYLNAGPGAIAGIFVHSQHAENKKLTVLRGWWGHEKSTRFHMDNRFEGMQGAKGFQLSNPDVLSMTSLLASLRVFAKTDMGQIQRKSATLTAYLRHLLAPLTAGPDPAATFVTPAWPHRSGAQSSILVHRVSVTAITAECKQFGVIFDKREPGMIRIAPTALYNTFEDVRQATKILHRVIAAPAATTTTTTATATGPQ